MSRFLDTHHLAALVKTKRGNRSLRDVAQGLEDVSPSTLSRIEIENEKMLDVQTFLRLCDWLQVAPQELIKSTDEVHVQKMTIIEQIEALLRTDGKLPTELTDALIALLKATYNNRPKGENADACAM